MSTSRQTARRRARPAAGHQVLGRGGQAPASRSSVRSRSRSPSARRPGTSRRVPRAGPAARRPSSDEHPGRQPPRRRAQLPVGGQRPGRPAARRPRRGRRPAARANASSSSSPTCGRDVAEARRAGRPARRRLMVRRRAAARAGPGAGAGWRTRGPAARPAAAVSFSRAARGGRIGCRGPAPGGGGPVARPDAVEHLVDDRLRACGRSPRRAGSGRTARRSAASRRRRPGSGRRSPRSRASPASSSTRSIAPRTEAPIRTSRVLAGGPGQRAPRAPTSRAGSPVTRGDDLPLGGRVLVAEHDPAHPVGDRLADPRGADRVERVHRRDQPEARRRPATGPSRGTCDLALGQHGDQDVERLLGDPVELLEVEQARRRASPSAAARR